MPSNIGHRRFLRVAALAVLLITATATVSTRTAAVDAAAVGPISAPVPERVVAGSSTGGASTGGCGPGYSIEFAHVIGETPVGFSIWLDPHAPHPGVLAAALSTAAGRLRSLGASITYRGYGQPAAAAGTIRVSEGPSGCIGSSNRVANTWAYTLPLANGDAYMSRSDIVVCPRLFRYASWNWYATTAHELGHALGLGHTNYVYGGRYQLMNSTTHYGITTYQAGDINGLRRMLSGAARIRNEWPAAGNLDAINLGGPGVVLDGWGAQARFLTHPVLISLYDNGRLQARVWPTVRRSDVNRALHAPANLLFGFRIAARLPSGHNNYCITATSTVIPGSVTTIGCTSWDQP